MTNDEALKRPTQPKPELTVELFKVGDWVIRKSEYRVDEWIWGDEPCEITMVRDGLINLKFRGGAYHALPYRSWDVNYFTIAVTG